VQFRGDDGMSGTKVWFLDRIRGRVESAGIEAEGIRLGSMVEHDVSTVGKYSTTNG
jgi:hypothetical protein